MNLLKVLSVALFGAQAIRTRRSNAAATTKFIEDVPILNYHLAYEGRSLVQSEGEALKGEWIVMMQKNVKDAALRSLCGRLKCRQKGHANSGGVPFFEFEGTEADLEQIVKGGEVPVKFIEPDTKVYAEPEIAEEEQKAASWGLDRVGAAKRANEGAGSHVYILDTGIRTSHSDFGNRAVPTLDFTSGSPVVCGEESDASCSLDVQGHGTHCAGTAAGATFGVAPKATIHAVKVLGDRGSGSWSWIIGGLDYLATSAEKPAVGSMSLGSPGINVALGEAVAAAANAGVVVVVTAGNRNSDTCGYSPGYSPDAITVGSTTSLDVRSPFSSYGPCVDIWAPGSRIISASVSGDNDSTTKSGTSMACPHVSGGAALILEKSPTLAPAEVLNEMLRFATVDAISDLKPGDTNRMLYVGADAVETPLP